MHSARIPIGQRRLATSESRLNFSASTAKARQRLSWTLHKPSLMPNSWKSFDPYELRLLLDKHFGGPGQYDNIDDFPNKLYLPLARVECVIALGFRDDKIISIEPGQAFDDAKWQLSRRQIETSILGGPMKVGRDYSFSRHRVTGSWRGAGSGAQILPPPPGAPTAPMEMADNPFILEFPVKASDQPELTNYRRIRQHRSLTLVLNMLLPGGASLAPLRPRHFWAAVRSATGNMETEWVQEFFFADLGQIIQDELSPPAATRLAELNPGERPPGIDGLGLRVPSDLDEFICLYFNLTDRNRAKFDRAAFWMRQAFEQWDNSTSASFAALVTAAEALTERGATHRVYCKACGGTVQHEVPGATERFRNFFETHAPGASLRSRRSQMYALRSGILHGSTLTQLDQNRRFGGDPSAWQQDELHRELWALMRTATRSWLRSPSREAPPSSPRRYAFLYRMCEVLRRLFSLKSSQ
jgi:hypothetical protein